MAVDSKLSAASLDIVLSNHSGFWKSKAVRAVDPSHFEWWSQSCGYARLPFK